MRRGLLDEWCGCIYGSRMFQRSWFVGVLFACGCLDPDGPAVASPGETTVVATETAGESSGSSGSSEGGESSSSSGEGEGEHSGTTVVEETTTMTVSTSGGDPLCGDGQVDPGEECDDGVGNGEDEACLEQCIVATCGDGKVRKVLEECDDANMVATDGCHQCYRSRKVFVTSEQYHGAQFMGIEGADQRCRSLAAQAGLANFAGFKAWLSDSRSSARDRMHHGRGRYELVNGLLVAENWDALVAGELQAPINATEKSEVSGVSVWTDTNPDGTTAGSDHCLDWTNQDFGHTAFWGVASEITADWTMADSPLNPQQCSFPHALYCFEQK